MGCLNSKPSPQEQRLAQQRARQQAMAKQRATQAKAKAAAPRPAAPVQQRPAPVQQQAPAPVAKEEKPESIPEPVIEEPPPEPEPVDVTPTMIQWDKAVCWLLYSDNEQGSLTAYWQKQKEPTLEGEPFHRYWKKPDEIVPEGALMKCIPLEGTRIQDHKFTTQQGKQKLKTGATEKAVFYKGVNEWLKNQITGFKCEKVVIYKQLDKTIQIVHVDKDKKVTRSNKLEIGQEFEIPETTAAIGVVNVHDESCKMQTGMPDMIAKKCQEAKGWGLVISPHYDRALAMEAGSPRATMA